VRKKKKKQDKNIMSASVKQGGHAYIYNANFECVHKNENNISFNIKFNGEESA